MPARSANGFTLIELSIVIVIIGLVAGGILLGRDLIRAAEVRRIHSQYQEIATAIHTFRSKYNCLPGDCLSATSFFGAATPGGPSNYCPPWDTPPGVLTCDGNGDGRIYFTTQYANPAFVESFLAWQHLANAELIGGGYSGTYSTAPETYGRNVKAGYNCPTIASKDKFCWLIQDVSAQLLIFDSAWAKGHYIRMWSMLRPWYPGAPPPIAPSNIGMLTAHEASSYDTKYDNGLPGTGKVQTFNAMYNGALCTTLDAGGNFIYLNQGTSYDCMLAHHIGL